MDHVSDAVRPVDSPTTRAARPAIPDIVTRTISSAVVAAVALPALAIAGAPVHASALQMFMAIAIAVLGLITGTALASGRVAGLVGVAVVSICAWLLAQVSFPAAAWVVAPALGFGAGLISPARNYRQLRRNDAIAVIAAIALAGVLVALRAFDRDTAMAAGAALAAVSALAGRLLSDSNVRSRPRMVLGTVTGVVLALSGIAFVGATTPRVTWFGGLVSHGPRNANLVAITFDDGPDPPYTLQIRDILDSHGAKATFFTVGKALDARPDVSRTLLDDGMLLGNHSYHHDAVSWLDPRYPELKQTEDAFRRNLGVCPAFYRPPHGSHTPFMAHVVGNASMSMVTWDVSAGDWATADGDLVARRVLDHVKPGSIILLHDGIDGNIGADRSVILAALPQILDGLRQRGLQPVTLDKLVGKPGYLPSC